MKLRQMCQLAGFFTAVGFCLNSTIEAQPVRLPGPSGGNGTIGVREVINNGEVSGLGGAIQSLKHLGPTAIVRDYQASSIDITDWKGISSQSFEVVRQGDAIPGLVNDLAMAAHGRFRVPEGAGGEYSILVQSDDAFELWIYEQSFVAATNAVNTHYGSMLFSDNRAPTNSIGLIELEPGDYDFQLIYNERGGGAAVQLAAVRGSYLLNTPEDRVEFVPIGAAPLSYAGRTPHVAAPWSVREVHRKTSGVPTLVSLEQARELLHNPGVDDVVLEGQTDAINLSNPTTRAGDLDRFGGDEEFLYVDAPNGTLQNFVFRAQSTLVVETSGEYTLGFNSDDGGELTIAGASFSSIFSPTKSSITNAGQTLTADFESPYTLTMGVTYLEAGTYPIEFTMWNGMNHTFAEVFAAQGAIENFVPGMFRILTTVGEDVTFERPAGLELVEQRLATRLGDADGDDDVDLDDLNAVRNGFGGNGLGDVDGDLDVDLDDLNAVRNHFGETGANPVPEPSTLLLTIGFAIAATAGTRRRRRD